MNHQNSARIFKKTSHKQTSNNGIGKSEITTIQERAHDLTNKINSYYKKHYDQLVDKEFHRLTRSTVQTHLRYTPNGTTKHSDQFLLAARQIVSNRQHARTSQVSRISQRMQWKVVENSQVMRARQTLKQENAPDLKKSFQLSSYKQTL